MNLAYHVIGNAVDMVDQTGFGIELRIGFFIFSLEGLAGKEIGRLILPAGLHTHTLRDALAPIV